MLLFMPRSLCALKRVAAKSEHARFGATQGICITLASGLYRAEATDGHRANVVLGLAPVEEPRWPGLKELPDDACEAVILPKDLERARKVGEDFLQSRFGTLGIATMRTRACYVSLLALSNCRVPSVCAFQTCSRVVLTDE